MKRLFLTLSLLGLAALVGAQTPGPAPGPGTKNAPGGTPAQGMGPNLKDLGLTEAQAKAVDADLKALVQTVRELAADMQVYNAQRNRLMVRDQLDRGEIEKIIRAQHDLLIKQELALLDLQVKWRNAYGAEKARALDGLARPGNPGNPGDPGSRGSGPVGPAPGEAEGPDRAGP